jgi:peptide/nickel transport system permease protein
MRPDYLLRRSLQLVVVLWGAATLNFLLPRLSPGNPVRERLLNAMAQGGMQQAGVEEMVQAYNQQFGLDKPLWYQYVAYLWNAMRLDFGYSIAEYPSQVLPMIMSALPWTIGLLVTATLISFVVGSLLGALIAWPRSPRIFQYLVGPMMTLSAIPYYLLGLILVYLLGMLMPLFPLSGGYSVGSIPRLSLPTIVDILHHSVLPGMAVVLVGIGFWSLSMRGLMVATSGEEFINFAEAKGLRGWRIFFVYAMRNAILPQVTALAINLGTIVSGLVVVEVVFGYPGIGALLFRAINGLDYFVIYGVLFMTVLAIAVATLAIDLLYPLLDPRITYRGA